MQLRRKVLPEIDPVETLRNLGLVEDETLGKEEPDWCFVLGSDGPVHALRRFLERNGKPAKRYRVDRGYVLLR